MNNFTDNKNIKYSIEAYNDGYDFSILSLEDQEATKSYYWSMQSMYELADATQVYNFIIKNKNNGVISLVKKSWTFDKSGTYKGIILDARNSMKQGNDAVILDILINSREIKHVKMTHDSTNVILGALLEKYDNLIGLIDLSELIGCVVGIEVENITSSSGNVFSKIIDFVFWDDDIVNLLYDMIDIMQNQDSENTDKETI